MLIDYKDVRFNFQSKKIKHRRRIIFFFSLVLLAVGLLLFFNYLSSRRKLNEIQDLLLMGKTAAAHQEMANKSLPLFFKRSWRELDALIDLMEGRNSLARGKLAIVGVPSQGIDHTVFCKYFADRAQYDALRVYTDHLLPLGSDTVYWFRALCQAALLDAHRASSSLKHLSAPFRKKNALALAHLQGVLEQLNKGKINFIFDRRGKPLALFDFATRSSRSLIPGIQFSDFAADFLKGIRFFHLTLDAELQNKVADVFHKDFFGTFVLLDAKEKGIVVAYSKPRMTGRENAAFFEEYEPGSIIKISTLLAYLHFSPRSLFPFYCQGAEKIGDKIFYDALPHGKVNDPSLALAWSCNLSFVRMGNELGYERLAEVLQKLCFGSPPFSDLFLRFPCGKYQAVGSDPFRLANLSVGLREVSITTLQAAWIAALVAEEGNNSPPYMIDHVKSVMDLGVFNHLFLEGQAVFAESRLFRKIKDAMKAAVENEKGTARRAKTEGISLAAKTGTAGQKKLGLDAIMIGFFPVDNPRYAFAFRLEGAGRAEFQGAALLKSVLQIFISR